MNQGPNVQTYLVVIVNIGANMVCAGGVQVYPYLFISSNKKISQDQDNDHKYTYIVKRSRRNSVLRCKRHT